MWYDKIDDMLSTSPTKFYTDSVNDAENSNQANNSIYEKVEAVNVSSARSNVERDNDLYEVIDKKPSEIKKDRASMSNVKRFERSFRTIGKSSVGIRDSLVGFKEGIPGTYSGFKLGKKRPVSLPDLPANETKERSPAPLPRISKNKNKKKTNAQFLESRDLSEIKENSVDMSSQQIIIDNSSHNESGVRYYDPKLDSAYSSSNAAVILPMSLADDLSDSSVDEDDESFGSEFESMDDTYEENNEIYDIIGEPRDGDENGDSNYMKVDNNCKPSVREKPPLPPRHSAIFQSLDESELEKDTYIRVEMDSEQEPLQLPLLQDDATDTQVQRYQILKCILENEKMFMKSLNRLAKDYEEPLYNRKVVNPDRIKVIFKYIDEILQCHQLFNMALSDRLKEWNTKEIIGDVIYASFSKSMAVKAYSAFVCNFTVSMDSIKETCKLVPAFLNFLKYRLHRNNAKQSLYDLMRQPLERIPQLVILLQGLLRVTPLVHADHLPLQMALTQLECLSEMLTAKRKDAMMKHKVIHLDKRCTGIDKPLASKKRYYVRHDDMFLCLVENGEVVKTKLRRLFLLNDLLVCASILNKQKRVKLMTNKQYKIKWCLSINDVDIVDVGSGISVKVDEKTTTIKYLQPFSSPRPGLEKTSKVLEDLQHDIAIIGEISGKVASLRRSYRFIDSQKVTTWYNDVKAALEKESNLANMNWIELSIPVRKYKNERMNCLFNVHSPHKKLEWSAEFENAKLRLSEHNNPGWYLQEEDILTGETAVLRRTLPLVSKIMPLFTIEQKYSIQCLLEVPMLLDKPNIWLFSGNEHIGYITVIEMNMSSQPHVTESFLACEARICCTELVPVNQFEQSQYNVWIGTMSGVILIFNPNSESRHSIGSCKLKDSIISIKYTCSKVFVGLANGTIGCFRCKSDGSWDFHNPTIICLGAHSILDLTEVNNHLWCACGPQIFVLDIETLATQQQLNIVNNEKVYVKHLIKYGIGIWVSIWKSPKLQLFHAETFEQLQTITVTPTISRMKDDIDGRIQIINLDKIYVTSLHAKEGLLWVGVNEGLILTYPLPKLGGVPTVSGLACVSFHAHSGPVKHIHSFRAGHVEETIDEVKSGNDNFSVFQADTLSCSLSELDKSTELSNAEPVYYVVEKHDRPNDNVADDVLNVNDDKEINVNVEDPPVNEDEVATSERTMFRPRGDTYDSDDEISADQDFSFIENEKKDSKSFLTGISDETKLESLSKVVPELKKNGFADLMENFQGFSSDSVSVPVEETLNVSISNKPTSETLHAIQESPEKGYTDDETGTPNKILNNHDNPDNVTIVTAVKESAVSPTSTVPVGDNIPIYEHPADLTNTNQSPLLQYATLNKNSTADNGYEPITTDKTPINTPSKPNTPVVQPANFESAYDQYRGLPLPQSPELIEDLSKSPPVMSTPKNKAKSENKYTPLITNDERSESVHSATGISAFEREVSLNEHQDKPRNDYTSLVTLGKREEDERKKYLVNPRFVLSVGLGHVDLRKRVKPTGSLDFFRSFSTGEPQPLFIIWKLV